MIKNSDFSSLFSGVCALFLFALFIEPAPAHSYELSSEFHSAQAAKAAAYNRLFRELDQSPNPRAAYPAASKKIMEPAQTQYSKALDRQLNSFISELKKSGVDFIWTSQDFREDPHATDPELRGDDGPNRKNDLRGQARGGSDGMPGNRGAVIQDSYSRPDLVLDGSKVQKEISFPGAKKASPPAGTGAPAQVPVHR